MIKEQFTNLSIQQVLIPPRMTNLLQPADVSWFAAIKSCFHQKWNSWYLNEEKTYTKAGNPRSPGYAKCIIGFQKFGVILI